MFLGFTFREYEYTGRVLLQVLYYSRVVYIVFNFIWRHCISKRYQPICRVSYPVFLTRCFHRLIFQSGSCVIFFLAVQLTSVGSRAVAMYIDMRVAIF